MMNGAGLGQTATSNCWDIFIFPTALHVPACVRWHLWDVDHASILGDKLCQTLMQAPVLHLQFLE